MFRFLRRDGADRAADRAAPDGRAGGLGVGAAAAGLDARGGSSDAPAHLGDGTCADSASWSFLSKSGKRRDCGYVSKKASKRCKTKISDEEGVHPYAACPASCETCGVDCTADSTSWYTKKPSRDCAYVAKKAKRCKATFVDADGATALAACPAACAMCAGP